MVDDETVALFSQIRSRYPLAAAGLIEDICAELSNMLHHNSGDEVRIASICKILSQCFRPMDTPFAIPSYAGDAAYAVFGKWLMRDLSRYRDAVVLVTGWDDEQLAKCKTYFIDMSRITRDDWVKAVEMIDHQTAGNNGMDTKGSINRF